jgi:ferric-dicitrate binding protein FerR (iron transport regulator)
LVGEAYFEVVSDSDKPFKIYSANAVVKVLGTKFNVRAWEETGRVEVAIVEGMVSFGSHETPEKNVILNKGFASSLSEANELTTSEKVDVNNILSWMKGEMSFDDNRFSEILSQVERWYDIKFSLRDSTIINERLSVTIHKNSLSDVLEVLSTLTDTEYLINDKVITLIPRESKE